MADREWIVQWEDVVEGRIRRSAEDTFTAIYILYPDRESGEERVASAFSADAGDGLMLLERAVRSKTPLSADEAQALADRAVAVGDLGRHGFVSLRLDQPLSHGGTSRPASEIEEGDAVQLPRHADPLRVFGVMPDPEGGTVLLTLGEEHHRERLELEIELLRLERAG
jgi:hypothetical protein